MAARKSWWPPTWLHDTTEPLAGSPRRSRASTIPRQKILAVFDSQAEQYQQPDFKGCAFIAASTEAPADGLVEHAADQFRAWVRAMFTDLAEQAGAPDPASLGRQLHLIYDGAGLAGRMDHHDPALHPPPAKPLRRYSTPR